MLNRVRRILAIGAHPDDVELGCGGLLAQIRKQNPRAQIEIICVTSGEEGVQVRSRALARRVREQEAKRAAKVLGVNRVHFLRATEGEDLSKTTRVALLKHIRKIRPELILTHSSVEARGDHRRVFEAVREVVDWSGGPWYPSCGRPHAVQALWGFEVWTPISQPQVLVNYSPVQAIKNNALACHGSQMGNFPYQAGSAGLGAYRAALQGQGGVAEAFEVIFNKTNHAHWFK